MSNDYYLYYGRRQQLNKNTPLLKKLFGLLFQPRETLFDEVFSLGEGLLVLGFLLLASVLQQFLVISSSGNYTGWLLSLFRVFFQALMIWFLFSLLYHAAARFLGGVGRFVDILGLMAYASFPLTLFTLLSILLGLILPVFWPSITPGSGLVFTLLYLAGLLWGWLGYLAYAILRWGEGLSRLKAGLLILVILLVYSAGFVVPVN